MSMFFEYDQWVLNEASIFTRDQMIPIYVDSLNAPQESIQFHMGRGWKNASLSKGRSNNFSDISYLCLDVQEAFGKYPMFFAKVKKEGIKWVECEVKFINRVYTKAFPRMIRFDKKRFMVEAPPEEYKYIKHLEFEDGDQKFIEKDDPMMLDTDGESTTNPAGTYLINGINYKLTYKNKKAYFYVLEKSTPKNFSSFYSIEADYFLEKQENLSEEQLKVIAKECSKYIGATVKVYDNGDFMIPWFTVQKNGSTYASMGIQAYPKFGPFFTRDAAQDMIEYLKKENKERRLPFNPEDLEIEESSEFGSYRLTLKQLLDYVKTFEIDIDLPSFLEKHRGSIAAKKFGF